MNDPDNLPPRLCLVLDDISGALKRDARVAHSFSRYRHYNLTIFLSNQAIKTIPTVCRSMATAVFLGLLAPGTSCATAAWTFVHFPGPWSLKGLPRRVDVVHVSLVCEEREGGVPTVAPVSEVPDDDVWSSSLRRARKDWSESGSRAGAPASCVAASREDPRRC